MRTWLLYAGAALVVAVAGGAVGAALVGEASSGVWLAAALAYTVQLAAFGLLLWARSDSRLFLVGWLGGMLVRMGVVAAVAIWVTRTRAYAPAPTLVSLVMFVFVMLLLEPVFLNRGRTTA